MENKNYLISILTEKLKGTTDLPESKIRFIVISSIEESFGEVNKIEELLQKLREGIVHFSYRKQDGSFREAWGTRNFEIIENHGELKCNVSYCRNRSKDFVAYFDVEKNAWRCFAITRFIEIL